MEVKLAKNADLWLDNRAARLKDGSQDNSTLKFDQKLLCPNNWTTVVKLTDMYR